MDINYITPTVTPMTPEGDIIFESCASLYKHLLDGGVDGVLLFGSIGEFFGFDIDTKKELIDFASKHLEGKTQFIVGTTSLVYDEIVELSRYALEHGADAVIAVAPYYFYFGDESVYDFYAKLAEDIPGKLYLYNFPDRMGYTISPETVKRLAQDFDNIIGIKDTISGMDHTREIIKAVKPVRPDFLVYSGFDDNFAHNVLSGGNGCIGGISNLFPELTSKWTKAARESDFNNLSDIQQTIDSLMDIYLVGTPFVPFIKEALKQKGIIKSSTATVPMPKPSKEETEKINTLLLSQENN